MMMTDPPGVPGLPEIVDWDEHMVELKWEPPFRDGGAPITGNNLISFMCNISVFAWKSAKHLFIFLYYYK